MCAQDVQKAQITFRNGLTPTLLYLLVFARNGLTWFCLMSSLAVKYEFRNSVDVPQDTWTGSMDGEEDKKGR